MSAATRGQKKHSIFILLLRLDLVFPLRSKAPHKNAVSQEKNRAPHHSPAQRTTVIEEWSHYRRWWFYRRLPRRDILPVNLPISAIIGTNGRSV
jgi:hypothetical protein